MGMSDTKCKLSDFSLLALASSLALVFANSLIFSIRFQIELRDDGLGLQVLNGGGTRKSQPAGCD